MTNEDKLEIEITILAKKGTSIRELEDTRKDLCNALEAEISDDEVKIYQEPPSRSVDPAVVGTISLVLLPIVVDKIADLIIKWAESRNETSVKISIPVEGSSPLIITYNPRNISPANLKKLINLAIESVNTENNPVE